MSAFRNSNFTDRFPAMNPKGGWSRRDPHGTDDCIMDNGGMPIIKLPVMN